MKLPALLEKLRSTMSPFLQFSIVNVCFNQHKEQIGDSIKCDKKLSQFLIKPQKGDDERILQVVYHKQREKTVPDRALKFKRQLSIKGIYLFCPQLFVFLYFQTQCACFPTEVLTWVVDLLVQMVKLCTFSRNNNNQGSKCY